MAQRPEHRFCGCSCLPTLGGFPSRVASSTVRRRESVTADGQRPAGHTDRQHREGLLTCVTFYFELPTSPRYNFTAFCRCYLPTPSSLLIDVTVFYYSFGGLRPPTHLPTPPRSCRGELVTSKKNQTQPSQIEHFSADAGPRSAAAAFVLAAPHDRGAARPSVAAGLAMQ